MMLTLTHLIVVSATLYVVVAQQRTFVVDERVFRDTLQRATMPLLYSLRHPSRLPHNARAARTLLSTTMLPSGRFLSMGQMPTMNPLMMSPLGMLGSLGPLGLLGAIRPLLGGSRTGLEDLDLLRGLAGFPGSLGLASDRVQTVSPSQYSYDVPDRRQIRPLPSPDHSSYDTSRPPPPPFVQHSSYPPSFGFVNSGIPVSYVVPTSYSQGMMIPQSVGYQQPQISSIVPPVSYIPQAGYSTSIPSTYTPQTVSYIPQYVRQIPMILIPQTRRSKTDAVQSSSCYVT